MYVHLSILAAIEFFVVNTSSLLDVLEKKEKYIALNCIFYTSKT